MSRELRADSGRLTAVQQDDVQPPQHPYGNFVVTDDHGNVVFDEWSHFAGAPPVIIPPTPPDPGWSGPVTPIRVTDGHDALNRMYSYWSACVVIESGIVLVMVPSVENKPKFYKVRMATRTVAPLGPLLPYEWTGEGAYFDKDGWVYLCHGPQLLRINPLTQEQTVAMDISSTHPGCRLWQSHSSDDGRVHSATVQRIVNGGAFPKIGTVVSRFGVQTFEKAHGTLDESHVDASGEWLVIKEDNDNRIVNLVTGEIRFIADANRALGHSDCGPGYAVGEADKPDPGMCITLDLRSLAHGPMFHTTNMGHVSVRAGRILLSDTTRIALVPPRGGSPIHLRDHGMIGGGYEAQPNANLSPCGTVMCWMSNESGQMAAYVADVPS